MLSQSCQPLSLFIQNCNLCPYQTGLHCNYRRLDRIIQSRHCASTTNKVSIIWRQSKKLPIKNTYIQPSSLEFRVVPNFLRVQGGASSCSSQETPKDSRAHFVTCPELSFYWFEKVPFPHFSCSF